MQFIEEGSLRTADLPREFGRRPPQSGRKTMRDYLKFFIGGKWVEPAQPKTLEVINPATETVCGHISLGSAADVDRAVKAAREAFKTFSQTSREERIGLLERIVAEYEKRRETSRKAITEEMGAPSGSRSAPRSPWARRIS